MSHANTNVIYPQSTDRDLSRWQVREDDDDYGNSKGKSAVQTISLLDLHNRVIDRLDRAKALTHLLQTADTQMDDTIQMNVAMLEELIEQAQRTSSRMWEYIQRERKGG
jgi:3-oxoacyl-(acyl-carrier-protein) synthase